MYYLLLLFLSFSLFSLGKVSVVPDYEGYVDTMFPKEPLSEYGNLGTWGKIKYKLKEHGISIDGSNLKEFPKNTDKILEVMQERSGEAEQIVIQNVPTYADVEKFAHFPPEMLSLIVYEPPSVEAKLHTEAYYRPFGKVFTWDDDLVDGEKFIKFHYPVMHPMKEDLVPFDLRDDLCMIARNKRSTFINEIYSERVASIRYFEKAWEDRFDLFGHGWSADEYPSYRGSIEDKYATLKKYKFSLCFENTKNIRGYVTEKIFDCFHCGVVPIYLGASNIEAYVPKECFIDMRDFASYEELEAFLETIDEERFEAYLTATRAYLETDVAKQFHEETFIALFLKEVCGIE